jgi:hypothetical protein
MAIERIPVDASASLAWTEVAQGARHSWHMLVNVPSPAAGSDFDRARELYPFEPVDERSRSYIGAALEHLMMWADVVAPFKFHPEQEIEFQPRPPYTLARAAMEAAAQAVWMLDTRDPVECIRRHLSLIRWDLQEQRRSKLDLVDKQQVQAHEDEVLHRVAQFFTEEQIRPPQGYLWVLRQACLPPDIDLEADEVERLWRAASGSAHGMYWPTRELQMLVELPVEDGRLRQIRVADAEQITAVLHAAYTLTRYAVLKYAHFAGADIPSLIAQSTIWLAGKITIREDANPDVVSRLQSGAPREPQ